VFWFVNRVKSILFRALKGYVKFRRLDIIVGVRLRVTESNNTKDPPPMKVSLNIFIVHIRRRG
jgi:hypothetical protein